MESLEEKRNYYEERIEPNGGMKYKNKRRYLEQNKDVHKEQRREGIKIKESSYNSDFVLEKE